MLPRLTAPMATALSGSRPTMTVSTMPMLIQPISASAMGPASPSMGQSSSRRFLICSLKAASASLRTHSRRGDLAPKRRTARATRTGLMILFFQGFEEGQEFTKHLSPVTDLVFLTAGQFGESFPKFLSEEHGI